MKRPPLCRKADVALGMQVVEEMRKLGYEPINYRSTNGDRATKGRWKGFVIEYTDHCDRVFKLWSQVRVIVECGVISIMAWGPTRIDIGPTDPKTPKQAAEYTQRIIEDVCTRESKEDRHKTCSSTTPCYACTIALTKAQNPTIGNATQ